MLLGILTNILGQEVFSAMRDQYMRAGEGFLLMYAIDDRKSFEELSKFRDDIFRLKETDTVPMGIYLYLNYILVFHYSLLIEIPFSMLSFFFHTFSFFTF